MSDESNYNFSGTFKNSAIGVGPGAQATVNVQPGAAATSRLDAQQLEELRAAIAKLAAEVGGRVPEEHRAEALRQVQELSDATIAGEEVDVPRIKRVTRWFATNAPDLAEAVTGLLFGPAVAALVGKAGGLATALLAPDEAEPEA